MNKIHTIKNYNKTVDTIAFLISSYNIWNKNIPDMIRGYFDDMNEIFRKLFVEDAIIKFLHYYRIVFGLIFF